MDDDQVEVMKANALPPNPKQAYGDKKPNIALVPPALDLYAAIGFADGAVKYGPYNWRGKSVEAMTYVAAIMRHLGAWVDREELSEAETFQKDGLTYALGEKPQLAHVAACVAILIDAIENGNAIDNRPPKGPSLKIQQAWHGKLPAGKPTPTPPATNLQELDERWVPGVARKEPPPLPGKYEHACPDLDQEFPPCDCPTKMFCSGENSAPYDARRATRVTCVRFKQLHEPGFDVV